MNGRARTHAVLLLMALALPLAAGQPWPRCDSSSGNYSARSTYEANLQNLIVTLRGNASSSPSLFASGALGTAPNIVYGLMLCRGDVSASDCFDCGTSALRDAGTACDRRIRDVALCYNQCYVRLSDTNFLASTNNSGEIGLRSGTNISSSDVVGYDRAVTGLLNATVQYAVDSSPRLFATGQWVGPDPGFSPIYSAAQCAADLSPAQCRSCLQDLLGQWWDNFARNEEGARIAGARCTLRSELGHVPFYTGAAMLQLPVKAAAPAPALAPGPAPSVVPGTTEGLAKNGLYAFPVEGPVLGRCKRRRGCGGGKAGKAGSSSTSFALAGPWVTLQRLRGAYLVLDQNTRLEDADAAVAWKTDTEALAGRLEEQALKLRDEGEWIRVVDA